MDNSTNTKSIYGMTISSLDMKAMAIAGLAFSLRAGLALYAGTAQDCSLVEYSRSGDGYQIQAVAEAWLGDDHAVDDAEFVRQLRERGVLHSTHLLRFFPVPAGLVAMVRAAGVSEGIASTVPFWGLSALAAGLATIWTKDGRIGVLLAALPPIQLYASSLPGPEGWFLVTTVGATMAATRNRPVVSGGLIGLALLARPEAVFAGAGLAWIVSDSRDLKALLMFSGATLSVAFAGMLPAVLRFWSLLSLTPDIAVKSANGSSMGFLALPGSAIASALGSAATPGWKILYVTPHVLAVVLAMVLLWRRERQVEGAQLERTRVGLAIWLSLHILFLLCLRGTQGFDDFPRYCSLALPAVAIGLAPFFPRARVAWVALVLCSVGLAILPARRNSAPECRSAGRGDRGAIGYLDGGR